MRFDFKNLPLPAKSFDPRRKLEGFETLEEALRRKRRLLSILPADGALADKIGHCTSRARCNSAACPTCTRRFRIRLSSTIARLIAEDRKAWHCVTLVPPKLSFSLGKLRRFDPRKCKDRLRRQLDRSGLRYAEIFGAFDFDVQTFVNAKRGPKWRPHLYILVRGSSKELIRAALARHYPRTASTPVPMKIRKIKKEDAIKVATYSFKATFNQRAPTRDRTGNRDTWSTPISEAQWAELAPLLDTWTFLGRQFLFGLDRQDLASAAAR